MSCSRYLWFCAALFFAFGSASVEGANPPTLWAIDPHVKVFRDAKPPENPGKLSLRAAGNEYEPAQLIIYSPAPLSQLRVECSPLQHVDGKATIGSDNLTWNFVGFVPIKLNTKASEATWIRQAPCDIPDPLLDSRTIDLPAEQAQPVWLTVYVPKDAAAGVYRGEVSVIAGDARAVMPIELIVDPFALSDERHLLVTNWFSIESIAKAHKADLWSDAFWALLERYARNMAAHRQNVVETPCQLIQATRGDDGKLTFDYVRFDRFVELFERAGVAERIEITAVAWTKKGWGSEIIPGVPLPDKQTGERLSLGAETGLKLFLADLEQHLDQRGWLPKAMIHICDEPAIYNLATWRSASKLVHQAAPRLRRIEAIETINFSGDLEVWVPKLNQFDTWRQAYEARRGDGEFWYYICCDPYGNAYPNRFLDYPLSKVRVLHWINFSEQLIGFLHWGLTSWGQDAFGLPREGLPPGDTHVIYPGSEGPLSSIRWEIERDSIEDFEYLWLLSNKTAELKNRLWPSVSWLNPRQRAEELCRRIVPAISDCEKDPQRILGVRQAIAEEIAALDQEPRCLVQTVPPEGTPLVGGPITVEVYGVVEPGATVRVDGNPVPVQSDHTFACRSSYKVQVEIEREGKGRTIIRSFPAR